MQGFFHTKKPQNLHENKKAAKRREKGRKPFRFPTRYGDDPLEIYSALSFFSAKMRFAMMPRIKAQAISVKVT